MWSIDLDINLDVNRLRLSIDWDMVQSPQNEHYGLSLEQASWAVPGTSNIDCPWNKRHGLSLEQVSWTVTGTSNIDCPRNRRHGLSSEQVSWIVPRISVKDCPWNRRHRLSQKQASWSVPRKSHLDKHHRLSPGKKTCIVPPDKCYGFFKIIELWWLSRISKLCWLSCWDYYCQVWSVKVDPLLNGVSWLSPS